MLRYRLNLQFFAQDDAQEKTEQATPKKRQELRKKGQVAKSPEVPSAMIMLFVFLLLFFIGPWMVSNFLDIFVEAISIRSHSTELSVENTNKLFQEMSVQAAVTLVPIMIVAAVAGVFGNYVQFGFLVSSDPLMVKLERLDPIKGAKRIFSLRALVELTKSMLKILLVGTAAFSVLYINRQEMFILSQKSAGSAAAVIGFMILQIGIAVSIVLLFLSILDYMYQRYDFEKQNRMSKQEIKDEFKRTEGDPLIRSKIKEKQREMATQRMMQEVPKADVVITNPTHFAVALKYDREVMEAPYLVAKGVDQIAMRIKQVATEHEVSVIENKPLARAIYHQVEIGQGIPEDLYQTVAEVLAYVYQFNGKT